MENKTNENTYDENKKKILAVDDESSIIDLLKYNLEKEGYSFVSAVDGEEGFNKVMSEKPDLVLLDVMLPKMDGLSVCRKIRQENVNVPVIMLSARGEEIDKILGLEIGADDYITKPFSTRELIARVKANLRKVEQEGNSFQKGNKITVGGLTLDTDKFEVNVRGEIIANSSSLFGPPQPNRKTCTARFAGFTATRSIIMSRERSNLSSIFGHRAPITMQSRGVVP